VKSKASNKDDEGPSSGFSVNVYDSSTIKTHLNDGDEKNEDKGYQGYGEVNTP
jgi:hypothetical protein